MILITGSSGFVGSNLINFFLRKKIRYIGIDKIKNSYLKNINFEKTDISNLKRFEKIFKKYKPQIIIHLAAISGVGSCHQNIDKAFKVNVEGTFNILYLAKKYKCKKILLASSFATDNFYTRPNYYGFTKKSLENMALSFRNNFQLDVGVIKFSNIFGPFSLHKNSAIHQLIKCNLSRNSFKIHGTGKQSRDFIYIDEVVSLLNKIVKSKKLNFINLIHTKKLTTLLDVIKIVNKISKSKTRCKFTRAPAGYDIEVKKITNRSLKNLTKNLKKTFSWYRSNYK